MGAWYWDRRRDRADTCLSYPRRLSRVGSRGGVKERSPAEEMEPKGTARGREGKSKAGEGCRKSKKPTVALSPGPERDNTKQGDDRRMRSPEGQRAGGRRVLQSSTSGAGGAAGQFSGGNPCDGVTPYRRGCRHLSTNALSLVGYTVLKYWQFDIRNHGCWKATIDVEDSLLSRKESA